MSRSWIYEMSITALIAGRLVADPEKRAGTNSKPYTLAKVSAATEGGDSLVSVIAFGSVAEQLAALAKGDSVSLTGRAKVSTWAGREGDTWAGLSLIADGLLTAYHLRRKRQAMAGELEGEST